MSELVHAMTSEAVSQAIERLWPGVAWTSERLDGGMTNRNFKVVLQTGPDAGRTVVAQQQLPDELAGVVGIHRKTQSRVLQQIGPLGLAPVTLGQFPELDVIVVEFVEGDLLSEVAERQPALRQLAESLGRLHTRTAGTTIQGVVSDPFLGTTWLFDQVHRESPELVTDFGWAMDVLRKIQKARGPYPSALLHADVSEGNVIFTHERAVLIDWEYAGAGDRYFDVGDFAEKAKLGPSEVETFVSNYCAGPNASALSAVRAYRFVSMLREGLWSLRAGTTGFLDFDHAAYADACLARMSDIAREPWFEDDLSLLARAEALS